MDLEYRAETTEKRDDVIDGAVMWIVPDNFIKKRIAPNDDTAPSTVNEIVPFVRWEPYHPNQEQPLLPYYRTYKR